MNIYTKNKQGNFIKVRFFSRLICVLCLGLFAVSAAKAQDNAGPRISLSVGEHRTLKSIFNEIQDKTSLHIIYDPQLINDNIEPQPQTFNAEPLSVILRKLGFTFTISNNTVILTKFLLKRKALMIKGQVTDTTGRGIPGVTVRTRTGESATGTDANGKFAINVGEHGTLDFTMVGFVAQEKELNNADPVNIIMKDDNANLREVVVVGYGVQKKLNLTGAVSTVKMDQLLGDRPVASTGELLEGAIPGLQVTQSNGAPGASLSYNVRGATDIPPTGTGNTISSQAPLILLDNVPFNGPLDLINPSDIESVTVLKDAGAASIYGARSAFGVVLITTRKGKKNQKPTFNYSNNLTLATPTNLPEKATVLQTIQSYKDMGTTTYWTGQDVNTWLNLANQYAANPGNFPNGFSTVGGIRYQLAPTNSFKNLLGNAKQYINNFSVTGGSDKITYRISLGADNQNGVIVPSSDRDYYDKYTVRSVVTSDVNKWVTIQLDASYYNSAQSTPPANSFSKAVNYAPYTSMSDTLIYNGVSNSSITPRNNVLLSTPTIDRFDDTRTTGRTILKPFSGFTITGEYTFDNLRELNTTYDAAVTTIDPRNFAVSTTGTSAFKKTNSNTDYHAVNIYANYLKSIDKHHFSILAGFNQEDNSFEQEWIQRTMPISAQLPSISQSTGPITGDDSYSEYAIRGYFGRFNYDYDDKYLLEVNGRSDASSNFPPGHRSGFFPSVSAGWNITKEKFMEKSNSWLDELKLRGSLGNVGNQNISPYQFVPGLTSYYANWLNGGAQVTTLNAPPLVSSNFTWETIRTIDAGADFGLFKNRFTGSFDVYQRDTKNMLYQGIQLPAVLGATAPLENVASLSSKGFEVQLNWRDKIGNVSYRIGANLYDFISKITNIQNQAGLLSQYYVGQQLGEIYGYVTDRLYTVNDFVPGTLNSNLTGGTLKPGIPKVQGEIPNPGDVLYKDLNGDGIINAGASTLSNLGDRKIIGNSSPRYQYGIQGAVSWKSFEFSFIVSGVGKQDQWRTNILSFPNYYADGTIYAYQLNYWTPTNLNSFYGRTYDAANGNQSFNEMLQTKYLLNGAYLKIKNLTLAYTIPAGLTNKAYINKFRLFVSVENAFMFDHLPKGLDPEIAPTGVYGYDYPFMRLYSIGANLSF